MERAAQTGPRPALPRVHEPITSRENRWLKRFRVALAGSPASFAAARDARKADDVVAVEGLRLVETALRSPVETVAVLFSDTGSRHMAKLAPWIPASAPLLRTSNRLFAQVSGTETPQGIAALLRPRFATVDELVAGVPLIVVLAGVQDPGNVGTLIRTAEAFGASGVAACSADGTGTANPFGPKALRASAGSALRVPVLCGVGAPALLAQLRLAGVRTYAACPDAAVGEANGATQTATPPWEIDWRRPAALLIGNEGAGLPASLVRSADGVVHIPQATPRHAGAPMESLNAAVAGGILLYEAARQRGCFSSERPR